MALTDSILHRIKALGYEVEINRVGEQVQMIARKPGEATIPVYSTEGNVGEELYPTACKLAVAVGINLE